MNSTPLFAPLFVLMPAYNEEGCIADVVEAWDAVLKNNNLLDAKILIVNDGSRDNTGKILDGLLEKFPNLIVKHQKNGGHGDALLNAYNSALEYNPAYIFQTDSDDQFELSDFKLLWDRRSESKFILGVRRKRYDAFHRLVITRIVRLVNALLFGRYIPDANIPFRLIKADYLKELLGRIPKDRFAPNIFLSITAKKDGVDLLNIPVTHRDRRTGQVSIVKWKLIKVCFRCVKELLEYRLG